MSDSNHRLGGLCRFGLPTLHRQFSLVARESSPVSLRYGASNRLAGTPTPSSGRAFRP